MPTRLWPGIILTAYTLLAAHLKLCPPFFLHVLNHLKPRVPKHFGVWVRGLARPPGARREAPGRVPLRSSAEQIFRRRYTTSSASSCCSSSTSAATIATSANTALFSLLAAFECAPFLALAISSSCGEAPRSCSAAHETQRVQVRARCALLAGEVLLNAHRRRCVSVSYTHLTLPTKA